MGTKKRGRPKLENRRTKRLLLRFTEEEYEQLAEVVKASDYNTKASFIRALISGYCDAYKLELTRF